MTIRIARSVGVGFLLASGFCHAFINSAAAQAAGIEGIWASKSSVCQNVFSRSKNGIVSFKEDSDAFGSGFVVEGDRIKGRFLVCKIIRRNQEKDLVHLLASCSSDVLLDTIQFSLRVLDDSRIIRVFPGIPELEFTYERCSL